MCSGKLLCRCLAAALVLCGWGCRPSGPAVSPVQGTVTMDGQPLPAARVEFEPTGPGRSSMAYTDNSGRYELNFNRSQRGALRGDHFVRISTYSKGDADSGWPAKPETVPSRYNSKSELTAVVENKKNIIDFQLESTGPVDSRPPE